MNHDNILGAPPAQTVRVKKISAAAKPPAIGRKTKLVRLVIRLSSRRMTIDYVRHLYTMPAADLCRPLKNIFAFRFMQIQTLKYTTFGILPFDFSLSIIKHFHVARLCV